MSDNVINPEFLSEVDQGTDIELTKIEEIANEHQVDLGRSFSEQYDLLENTGSKVQFLKAMIEMYNVPELPQDIKDQVIAFINHNYCN